jgi:DNA-binding NarL/FixJ family response regulator
MGMIVHGELRDGLQRVSEGLRIAERIQHRQWTAAFQLDLGAAYMDVLVPERALTHLRLALDLATEVNSGYFSTGAAGEMASAYVQCRDYPAAAQVLRDRLDPRRAPSLLSERQCWFAHAELLLAQGQPRDALAALDTALRTLTIRQEALPAEWLRLRGASFLALGQLAEAETCLNAALEATKTYNFPLMGWRVHASLAQLYAATGRRAAAHASREAARAIVAALAAQLDDDEVRETFLRNADAEIGSAPTQTDWPAPSVARLSQREREVLRLIADGASNQEIAAALRISIHTVGNHVSSILNKLGVDSRTAAAAQAVRLGLV